MSPKTRVETSFELIWKMGLRLLLWCALAYFLYRVRSVIVMVLIAAIVTYAVLPMVDFLCSWRIRGISRKLQRITATLVVFLILIGLTVGAVMAFFTPLNQELTSLQHNYGTYMQNLATVAGKAHKWYSALSPDLQSFLESQNYRGFADSIRKWGADVLSTTVNFLGHIMDIILVPVLAFYFTIDSRSLKREFVSLMPRGRARETLAILHEIGGIMHSYVIAQIILCVIAGLAVGVALHILRMPYALTLSVFAGVTRAVPVIGPIISGAGIVLIAAVKSPMMALNLLIFFALVQLVESKFIMPKLIGDRMQLHPAMIIISLLIGAEFFGVFGMFMAAPVAAIIRVLIRYYFIKPKELHVWGLAHQTHLHENEITADELTPVVEE